MTVKNDADIQYIEKIVLLDKQHVAKNISNKLRDSFREHTKFPYFLLGKYTDQIFPDVNQQRLNALENTALQLYSSKSQEEKNSDFYLEEKGVRLAILQLDNRIAILPSWQENQEYMSLVVFIT